MTTATTDPRLRRDQPRPPGIRPRDWYAMSWHQRAALLRRLAPVERDIEHAFDLDRPRRGRGGVTNPESQAEYKERRRAMRDQRREQALEMRDRGIRRAEIAAELGVDEKTLRNYFADAPPPKIAVAHRARSERDERARKAVAWRTRGHPIAWIARELDVSDRAVHRYLKNPPRDAA